MTDTENVTTAPAQRSDAAQKQLEDTLRSCADSYERGLTRAKELVTKEMLEGSVSPMTLHNFLLRQQEVNPWRIVLRHLGRGSTAFETLAYVREVATGRVLVWEPAASSLDLYRANDAAELRSWQGFLRDTQSLSL